MSQRTAGADMNTTIKTFDFNSDAGDLLASVRTVMVG